VDILVNNAGVMQLSEVEKGLSDEWRTMFDVKRLVPKYKNPMSCAFALCWMLRV